MNSGKREEKERRPEKGSYECALIVIRVQKPCHSVGFRGRIGFRGITSSGGNIYY
jgi:hypothetical protein